MAVYRHFGFAASAEVVTTKKQKTAYRRKTTSTHWFYRLRRSRYRQKTKKRPLIPPKNYRRMTLPPQKYRQLWYRLQKYRHVGGVRSDGSAPFSRYPITGVQTHAGTFSFGIFYFFFPLFFWFFGSFGFFSRTLDETICTIIYLLGIK